MPQKVVIRTLGCKLNQFESEAILTQFRNAGWELAESMVAADVCVVNTCAVTATAERKARGILRSVHRNNPEAKLLAVGCMAENSVKSLSEIDGISAIIGNEEKTRIIEFLTKIDNHSPTAVYVGETANAVEFSETPVVEDLLGRTRAFLKIQDGCSQKCTYCIIPRLRGVGRSLSPAKVIEQAQRLVDRGFVEIVLTGVALGTYGFDVETRNGLVRLLGELEKIRGLKRIRLGSVEPWAIDQDFIQRIAESEVICPHLHIPLQSAEDTVLRRMNRRYTVFEISHIFECAFKWRNDWGFGADILTGFPGESERNFLATFDFLAQSPLGYLHIFPFSARPGTAAVRLPDAVSEQQKKSRVDRLQVLNARLRESFREQHIGRSLPVLYENRHIDGMLAGHAANYLDVLTDASDSVAGTIQQTLITSLHHSGVVGAIIGSEQHEHS